MRSTCKGPIDLHSSVFSLSAIQILFLMKMFYHHKNTIRTILIELLTCHAPLIQKRIETLTT